MVVLMIYSVLLYRLVFIERAKFGKEKYNTDLDRTDLGILDWLEHAKQEHMDAILYLEKIERTIKG